MHATIAVRGISKFLALALALVLASCGGGGGGGDSATGGGGPAPTYTLGGTVSGLEGTGLALRNNGGDDLPVSGSGTVSFTFSAQVASGTGYSVAVQTQPTNPSQTCTVMSNGSGTMGSANVTNVSISCIKNKFTVGGAVSGRLPTDPNPITLRLNGTTDLDVSGNAVFAFGAIDDGLAYAVAVVGQPSGQICGVGNANGTLAGANVTNLAVTCVSGAYLIGVTVNGLLGTGLVLQNNLTDNLLVAPNNTTLPFGIPIVGGQGQPYSVTVHTQPSNPSQTCSVPNGTGTVPNSNVIVVVTCVTNKYTVGGTISGFSGTGLKLRNNNNIAGDEITVAPGAVSFSFSTQINSGEGYAVIASAQPSNPTQTCAPSPAGSGQGTVGNGPVSINIVCTTNTYTIGGTISGLSGTGLKLRNNNNIAGDQIDVAANATSFAFSMKIASGGSYNVTAFAQPSSPTQTCAPSPAPSGAGTVTNADISINIVCTTNSYRIGGTVTTLAGAGLKLRNNNNALDEIEIQKTGPFTFTFGTPIASGSQYDVKVFAHPINLSQTCSVSNGGPAIVGGADVTNVGISCLTNNFTVGGTVSGHNGTGMTLRLNGTTNVTPGSGLPANGPFAFPGIPDGSNYTVEVLVHPLQQTCTLTNPTGTLAGANVANITVDCQTNKYPVGGTISGLSGSNLVLHNGSENLTVLANATTFTFLTQIEYNTSYSVTVSTQPSSPTQTCEFVPPASAAGTVLGPVTSVNIVCTTNTYTIGGTISGLSGTGLKLRNNNNIAGDEITVPANATSFAFTTKIASGGGFDVTAFAQPSNPTQTCAPSPLPSGAGTVTNAIISINIVCTTTPYTIGGTISGLSGTGLKLRNNDNPLDELTILAGATTFSFGTQIASGAGYAVTVPAQPSNPTQTCAADPLPSGSGTVTNANVSINIVCTTNIYTVGGTITGLTSTGLVLRSSGGLNDLTVLAGSTSFTFTPAVLSGTNYAATVLTQPIGQICNITSGGSGTVLGVNVVTVVIGCAVRPVAPSVDLGFKNPKQLKFTWPVVSGATYKFFEDPDGILGPSGYAPIGGNLATPTITHTIPVHRRLNASYVYQVCIGALCGPDSDALILGTSLTHAIGYVKASNPGQTDIFGVSISMSTDGNTLAIGAYLEDSAAAGINGSEVDDCDAVTPVNCAPNSGAVYVFTRNTTTSVWSQQAYIKASNPGGGVMDPVSPELTLVEGDEFGRAVALSGDGNTLAVGARNEDSAGLGLTPQVDDCAPIPLPPAPPPVMLNCAANSGAVYVFTRTTGVWSQQAYVKASNTGGGAWDPIMPPVPPETVPTGTDTYLPGDQFGLSVALNSDGSTLAVGAPLEDSGDSGDETDNSAEDSGAVYVFTRTTGVWTQQAYVKASNIDAADQFGYSVALSGASGNGTTLAVGARLEEGSGTGVNPPSNNLASSAGAAYVFTRNGAGDWSQQAYLKASNTDAGDEFGSAVALSTDGNTLAVGAPFEDSNGSGPSDNSAEASGAAYVYTRSGGTWSFQAYLKASNPGGCVNPLDCEGDDFGRSVALSGDGNTLAVGAPNEDSNATGIGGNQADDSVENAGAVYVFTRSVTTWSQQAYVKVTPGFFEDSTAFDSFGGSVALNSDGSTLAAGADHQEGGGVGINPTRDISSSLAGAVYLY